MRFACGSLLLVMSMGAVLAQQPANPCTKPVSRMDQASWKKRHETFLDRYKNGGVDVLFVGDSITQGWEGGGKKAWDAHFKDWKPGNIGISGDRTEHVLWRITEGKEIESIDPKVVVIMIGTNNVSSNSAEQIAEGITAIVKEFRKQKPKAKILLLGVFPRSLKPGKEIPPTETLVKAGDLQPKIQQINDIIAKLDDGKSVKYLDIGGAFLDKNGNLPKAMMPDYLHLSGNGYEKWASAINDTVESLLKLK